MTSDARPAAASPGDIERAKNLAAVRAMEAYAKCLQEMLSEEQIAAIDFDATSHVHTAVMLVGDGTPLTVAIIAHWMFSTQPDVVERVLAADQKHKGAG